MGQVEDLSMDRLAMMSWWKSWLARSACPFFEQSRCQSRQLSETDVKAFENAENCRADCEVSEIATRRCGESATPHCCDSATDDALKHHGIAGRFLTVAVRFSNAAKPHPTAQCKVKSEDSAE